jgi:hypothetical protein
MALLNRLTTAAATFDLIVSEVSRKRKEVTFKDLKGELNEEQRKAALVVWDRVDTRARESLERMTEYRSQAKVRLSTIVGTRLALEEGGDSETMDTGKKAQLKQEVKGFSKERRKDLETAVKFINDKTKEIQEELAQLDVVLNK